MTRRNKRLAVARKHGRRAVTELRRMAADSALYWILSHKGRVAQFRRAVKGTGAQRALDTLMTAVREDATSMPARHKPRKAARRHASHRQRTKSNSIWTRAIPAPGFLV